jgi:aldose sugar dehydrogenase
MMLVEGIVALALVAVISSTLLADVPDDELDSPLDLDPFIENLPNETGGTPELTDESLKVEGISAGLSLPTGMAFVDDRMTIVLEKNSGSVFLISFEEGTKKQLLQLNAANGAEQGLLGVAVADTTKIDRLGSDKIYVFLYLTESDETGHPLGNRVYRYEWDAGNQTLVNPELILRLPAEPGPTHNGGKLVASNDGHLYAVIGNLNRIGGSLQNDSSGTVDDVSVILRVDFDGDAVEDNPFVNYGRDQLSRYYAYGIRNSFGIDIDPITGTLWDTENGENDNDEINVVNPGFNSGWSKVMGPIGSSGVTEEDLFHLEGSRYRDPVFTWKPPIGVTDIKFFDSDKLGAEYTNNIFIGDINGGALYHFKVNESRTGLDLSDYPELADTIADTYDEGFLARIGSFPSGITDLETGPDGFLYVLTFGGQIYRIVPSGQ